ncbi:TetR family transcriptional regulator C-terminal domain-containing protein [Methylibium sp.]|uniref:TetR/AcrR family transcriptional regulator n=1 Tax=Methylibium sp. TaxID=2067992 RepID=UPI003D0959A6
MPVAAPAPARSSSAAARRSHAERGEAREDTRTRLVRAGIETVLERGWAASGVDTILRAVGVPKGSFYHYFPSKDDFGYAVLEGYQAFFLKRLGRCFGGDVPGRCLREQFDAFLAESLDGMARHGWRRGCLVGALGQELGGLHEGFRGRLLASLDAWGEVLARAIAAAQARGEVRPGLDPRQTARGFWAAWEGAVLRARLARDGGPLEAAVADFRRLVAPD